MSFIFTKRPFIEIEGWKQQTQREVNNNLIQERAATCFGALIAAVLNQGKWS